MRPEFNLLTEPWIPVIGQEGDPPTLFGLTETLQRAHEFREIFDPSPLVTGALYRLLLAVLHRAFRGPADSDDWQRLWDERCFSQESLFGYLGASGPGFDLFDPERPFYQIARRTGEAVGEDLDPLLMFSAVPVRRAVTADELARLIVAAQTFDLGGLVSYERVEDKSAPAATLANSAMVLVRGRTLFETLLLNLIQYNGGDNEPFPFAAETDIPPWEQAPPMGVSSRPITGLVDWLTFQSRRIRIAEPQQRDGQWWVDAAVVMKGRVLPDGMMPYRFEPMVPFSVNRSAKPGDPPSTPLRFQEGRALWRDSTALVESLQNQRIRPRNLDWLAELQGQDESLPGAGGEPIPLSVVGMRSDQKKPLLWRHERFDLPAAYLGRALEVAGIDELRLALNTAIEFAEACNRELLRSGWEEVSELKRTVARPLQVLAEAVLPSPAGLKPETRQVQAFVAALQPEAAFWPRLDVPFTRLLHDLPADFAPGNLTTTARDAWEAAVLGAARAAFDDAISGIGFTGREHRARALAESAFNQASDRRRREFRKRSERGEQDE